MLANPPIIFLVFANDRVEDQRYLRNLPYEQSQIRDALAEAARRGICELVERQNVTLDQIRAVFQDERYRDRIAIFHYGGHASTDKILLETEQGEKQAVGGEGLMGFLSSISSLRLIFLNGCLTDVQARRLSSKGIPMVIGTYTSVADDIATKLAMRFYDALGKGVNVDQAWKDARNTTASEHEGHRDRLYRDLIAGPHERADRFPWQLRIRPGSESVANWNLPTAAKDPLFLLPPIPDDYYRNLPPRPFISLQTFQPKEAAIYFGRGQEIRELHNKLRTQTPIILYHGLSGVGKSSLLNAGLFPRLEYSHHIVYVRRNTQKGLSHTLIETFGSEDLLSKWLELEEQHAKPLLFIMDQVEEAYTQNDSGKSAKEEVHFLIQQLAILFNDPESKIAGKLILAFRTEYFARIEALLEEEELPFHSILLEPMKRDGIIEAVTGITKNEETHSKYQLEIQEAYKGELATNIADDLLKDKQSVIAPVLQIQLAKLWEAAKNKSQKPIFNLALYHQLDRSGDLLTHFFHEQLEKLEQWKPEVVDSGMVLDILYFFTSALGTAESRTLTEVQERYTHLPTKVEHILKQLTDLYLIYTDNKQVYRLSHDTLATTIRKAYQESDQPGQRAIRILESKNLGDRGLFLEEIDLNTVEEGIKGMRSLKNDENNLLENSQKEKRKRDRNRKFTRILAGVAACIILIFGGVAIYLRNDGIEKEKDGLSTLLAAESNDYRESNPWLSMRLAEAAYASDSTTPASKVTENLHSAFYNPLLNQNIFPLHSIQHEENIYGGSFNQNEDLVITSSEDGTIKFWDLTGKVIANLQLEGIVSGIDINQNGSRILTYTSNDLTSDPVQYGSTAKLWNSTGKVIARFQHKYDIRGASFYHNGSRILTYSSDGTAKLWDLTGRLFATLQHGSEVWRAIFNQEESLILTQTLYGVSKLWDVTGKFIANLQHKSGITGGSFNQNGTQILTYSEDGTIKLWDISGKPIATIKHKERNHEGRYTSGDARRFSGASFNEDGSRILTYSLDGIVKIWDISGKLITALKYGREVNHAAFNRDGTLVLTFSMDGTIMLRDISGEIIANFQHGSNVQEASFNQDETQILTYSEDGTIKLWSINGKLITNLQFKGADYASFIQYDSLVLTTSGGKSAKIWDLSTKLLPTFQHKDEVIGARFNQTNSQVLTFSADGNAKLWNVNGKLIAKFQHDDSVLGASFNKNETQILTYSTDGTAKLWNTNGKLIANFQHDASVLSASFNKDETKILTYSIDGTTKLWNTNGKLITSLNHKLDVLGALFNQNETQILTYSLDGTAKLWDTTGQLITKLQHQHQVLGAVFNQDETQILTYSRDNTAKLWDIHGKLLANFQHENDVEGANFNQNGSTILTYSGTTGSVKLWDKTGKLITTLSHSRWGYLRGVSYDRDETRIITFSDLGVAKLWNINGKLLANFQHQAGITGASFDQDEKRILTYSLDGTAKLWDTTGQLITKLQHQHQVLGAVFNQDETQILTYSRDNTAKLWDIHGKLLANFQHDEDVRGAKFTPDGSQILTYSEDGIARLWYTPKGLFQYLKSAPIAPLDSVTKAQFGIPQVYRE